MPDSSVPPAAATPPRAAAAITVRPSLDADLAVIHAIYGHNVRNGLASWEEVPPAADEMRRRREGILAKGCPFLVAELEGAVRGYAYASAYRPRSGYRFTVEDSIYVAPGWGGRGLGRALLARLISACEERGFRQMVAVIGDSQNAGSIGLHRSLGFHSVAVMPGIGWKFGRWIDSVLMQRALGPGDRAPPD